MLEREVPRQLRVSNGYAGQVPAFSCVQVTGATGRTLTVNRPSTNQSNRVLITGPQIIENGGAGHASRDFPLWVTTSGSPSAGDEIGPASGAFTMAKDNRGFVVLAMSGSLALVVPSWPPIGGGDGQIMKLTGALPAWAAASAAGHIWHPADMAETSATCDGADHDLDLTSIIGSTAVAVSLSLFHSANYWQLKRKDDTNMVNAGGAGMYDCVTIGVKTAKVTYNLSASGYALYRVIGWFDIT